MAVVVLVWLPWCRAYAAQQVPAAAEEAQPAEAPRERSGSEPAEASPGANGGEVNPAEDGGSASPCAACAVGGYLDRGCCQLLGMGRFCYQTLPGSLLWEVPLANQHEPRMFGKILGVRDSTRFDTALGAQIGLGRLSPADRPQDGLQLDVFGVVFTRFDDNFDLVASDYRAGLPLTYASGPWQMKLAYEHSSSQLGDEFSLKNPQFRRVSFARDEVVLGLACRLWDGLRVYGQYGYAFYAAGVLKGLENRFDWGLEWSRPEPTGVQGQPFGVFDMDLRPEHDHEPGTTLQVGWQWRANNRRSARLALEYYNGPCPAGQFFREREHWVGLAGFYDW